MTKIPIDYVLWVATAALLIGTVVFSVMIMSAKSFADATAGLTLSIIYAGAIFFVTLAIAPRIGPPSSAGSFICSTLILLIMSMIFLFTKP